MYCVQWVKVTWNVSSKNVCDSNMFARLMGKNSLLIKCERKNHCLCAFNFPLSTRKKLHQITSNIQKKTSTRISISRHWCGTKRKNTKISLKLRKIGVNILLRASAEWRFITHCFGVSWTPTNCTAKLHQNKWIAFVRASAACGNICKQIRVNNRIVVYSQQIIRCKTNKK